MRAISSNRYGVEGTLPAKKKSLNLDPNFLLSSATGELTSGDIVDEPYINHIWTYASAKVINTNVSKLPKILCNEDDPEDYKTDHAVLDLFDDPNPWMSSTNFWQAIVLGLLLPSERSQYKPVGKSNELITSNSGNQTGGQVFLICLTKNGEKVNLQRGDIPDVILPFYDKNVAPWEDKKDGMVKLRGWVWVDNANKVIEKFEPHEIIRINLFNPYEWTHGVSNYYPTSLAMADDIQSDIFNSQSFKNDGTVAGVLGTEMDLTDAQYNILYNRWMNRHGGVGRNNTIAVLGNGLKYQQIGLSQADMQFTDQKQFNFEKFAASYGLNKIAYGKYEEINFATIREGRKLLWQDTYKPLDQLITRSITDQWIKYIKPERLQLKSDYSDIEYLRPDYKGRANVAAIMVEKLRYTPAVASKMVRLPLTDEMIKEMPWLNEEPPAKQAGGFTPEPKKISEKLINKAFKNGQKLSEDERIALSWDYIHKVLDPGEKKWKSTLDRFFTSQSNRMQDMVDIWLKKQKAIPENIDRETYLRGFWLQQTNAEEGEESGAGAILATPAIFMLNPNQENEKLIKILKPLIKAQMKLDAKRLEQELGTLIEFNVTNDDIQQYIDARKQQIKDINTTTFKKANQKIGVAIEEAIAANDTPQEAAKRIKDAIKDVRDVRKNQAATIARTETATISNTTRFAAFHKEGIEWHEWLNAADERVRVDHMNMPSGVGGMIVKVGQTFPIVNLRFPSDPNGAPAQIINCRCVTIPAEEPKE